jgi:hypothetical protein
VGARGFEVELEPGGTRVAVARLPDRAWVQEPARVVERRLGPVWRGRPAQVSICERDRERDMAVADEHERRDGHLERGQGRLLADHVLPDRVARACVEELGAIDLRLRLEALEEGAVLVEQHRARPPHDRSRVRAELLQVEPSEDAQVVVADEAQLRALADDVGHFVRARPVADEVAEAPELVRRVGVDRLEDGLERV